MLKNKTQVLDMWTGKITSKFTYNELPVEVHTWADSDSDTVAIAVDSPLLKTGSLALFFDFPYPTDNKFDAPFVGVFNKTSQHTTTLEASTGGASIRHDLGTTSYITSMNWSGQANISGPALGTHRYSLTPQGSESIQLTVNFSPVGVTNSKPVATYGDITTSSEKWWEDYWTSGAFVDMTAVKSVNATELQRRTMLSLYLEAVNSASSLPPQGELLFISEKASWVHIANTCSRVRYVR